jgi:hypothetical protein
MQRWKAASGFREGNNLMKTLGVESIYTAKFLGVRRRGWEKTLKTQ